MSLFLFLSGILLGWYCRKSLAKKRGVQQKYKKEGWPYKGGLSIEGELKPSAHYGIEKLKGGT